MKRQSSDDESSRFEHKHEPLLSPAAFRRRMVRAIGTCLALVGFALGVGALGYHATEGWSWLDAALNASMILTGMGPVDEVHSSGGKVFAIVYALFSGVLFLSVAAIFLAPLTHRMLHAFHLELDE
jgi:hypothetical protein